MTNRVAPLLKRKLVYNITATSGTHALVHIISLEIRQRFCFVNLMEYPSYFKNVNVYSANLKGYNVLTFRTLRLNQLRINLKSPIGPIGTVYSTINTSKSSKGLK